MMPGNSRIPGRELRKCANSCRSILRDKRGIMGLSQRLNPLCSWDGPNFCWKKGSLVDLTPVP